MIIINKKFMFLLTCSFFLAGCSNVNIVDPNYIIDNPQPIVATNSNDDSEELTIEELRLKRISLSLFDNQSDVVKKQAKELFESKKGKILLNDTRWINLLNFVELVGVDKAQESVPILLQDNPKLLTHGEFADTTPVAIEDTVLKTEETPKDKIIEVKLLANGNYRYNTPVTRGDKYGLFLNFNDGIVREQFLNYMNKFKQSHSLPDYNIGSTTKGELLYYDLELSQEMIEELTEHINKMSYQYFIEPNYPSDSDEKINFTVEVGMKAEK